MKNLSHFRVLERVAEQDESLSTIDQKIEELLAVMSLDEKVGQMCQANASNGYPPHELGDRLRAGQIGSILNSADVGIVNELQRIAVEESRLGIPLLVGRDVIHGFKTVFPIPLGQAASWNPELAREGAHIAASEAVTVGINWTFAPMMDIARDARWGRIAESLGEDPYLASALAVAMVEGYQGDDLAEPLAILACGKHFAGYGAVESGRDYATTDIPENELRNVHLRPFHAAIDAGLATIMTSFSDLNGVPATGNAFLLKQVLRDEWEFAGFVVSDWDSVFQLLVHGFTENDKESCFEAVSAGVDMEMEGHTFRHHLAELVAGNRVTSDAIDASVSRILRAKFRLGLFDNPYVDYDGVFNIATEKNLLMAKKMALQSVVMLKNEDTVLPLDASALSSIAVIGPMADAAYDQQGTWVFDGDETLSVSCTEGIRRLVGDHVDVRFTAALATSRSRDDSEFDRAVACACESDAVVLVLGEEAILSGEAHSRADINLPGAQAELVQLIRGCGKPVIAVILAGRPLTLSNIVDEVDAILYAWHPGAMGGPAIAELLFGVESPSGKLPLSFPRMVGQIPIYYNRKNSGKPPTPDQVVHIDDIAARAPQTSLGMTAFHLDAGYTPLFPFGFGLSYANFRYSNIHCNAHDFVIGESVRVSADVSNERLVGAEEIVQLYVRDLVANVTRPIRELKGFKRVFVAAESTVTVEFNLHSDDLAFYGRDNSLMVEAGEFSIWIGGDSNANLATSIYLVDAA